MFLALFLLTLPLPQAYPPSPLLVDGTNGLPGLLAAALHGWVFLFTLAVSLDDSANR